MFSAPPVSIFKKIISLLNVVVPSFKESVLYAVKGAD